MHGKLYHVFQAELAGLFFIFSFDGSKCLCNTSNLYYKNGIYRTPAMFGLVSHNRLKMKEKGLLIYKKRGSS